MRLTLTEHWLYVQAYSKEEGDDWANKAANKAIAMREEKKLTMEERLDLEEWAWKE